MIAKSWGWLSAITNHWNSVYICEKEFLFMLMDILGGLFTSEVISGLVALASSYIEDYHKEQDMKVELRRLEVALPQIRSIIDAAESGQQQITDPLKAWLWQFKDALYEADDILDEFEYFRLKGQVEAAARKEAMVCGSLALSRNAIIKFSKQVFRQDPFLKRLRRAVKRLDEVTGPVGSFLALTSDTQQQHMHIQAQVMPNRETGPLLTENKVFGREKEREELIKWLVKSAEDEEFHKSIANDEKSNLSLLSVVGHGGMGKTTLVQLVYNDERVKKVFDLKIWVYVSTCFDVKGLTTAIVESATKERPKLDSLAALQDVLQEKLSSSKFLLVLDDVWNNDDRSNWEKLFAPLKYGHKGSKILLTTRMDQAAQLAAQVMGGKKNSVKLKGLQNDDLLLLFNQYAFAGVNAGDYKKLQSIGMQIARRLGGSPLAAKTLGGMLNTNLDDRHWIDILHRKISDIKQSEGSIMSILRLSYHYLPGHLRSCFAYCSIFPHNHKFDKDDLVSMWMAAGFIQQTSNQRESLEHIGCQYFDDLLKRSFFEPLLYFDKQWSQKYYYVMHDLLYDLACQVSDGECFRLDSGNPVENIPQTVRHLSVNTNNLDMLLNVEKWKKLRTLFLFFDGYDTKLNKVFQKVLRPLKSIRVLHASVYGLDLSRCKLGDLKHLRYLKLHPTICQLPRSLCKLYHLQVITTEWKHEDINILPKGMNHLISLRHLVKPWDNFNMVAGIGELISLQELRFNIVRKPIGYSIRELMKLTELRELEITGLENIRNEEEAREAELWNKKHLNKLKLEWDPQYLNVRKGSPMLDEQILDCLQPHSNLKELTVRGCGASILAVWMGSQLMENLEYVKLENCWGWEHLYPLGRLPFLKYLFMENLPRVKKVGFQGNFPLLEILHIKGLEQWEEDWSVTESAGWCPSLSELNIEVCPKMKVLPSLPLCLSKCELDDVGLITFPSIWQRCNSSHRCCSFGASSSSSSLSQLYIPECQNMNSLPVANSLLQHPTSTVLKELRIRDCEELLYLPWEGFRNIHSLKSLKLDSCPKLQAPTPTTAANSLFPSSLQVLQIDNCSDLDMSLNVLLQGLTSLSHLRLGRCNNMTSLPSTEVFRSLRSLKHLAIEECENLKSLGGLQALPRLCDLQIHKCPMLVQAAASLALDKEVNIGEHDVFTLGVRDLWIDHPSLLLMVPLRSLTSVQDVTIANCEQFEPVRGEVEQWLLQNGNSLITLRLCGAQELQSLPRLPAHLTRLRINGWNQVLEERCRNDEGADWHKISHIPDFQFWA